MQYLDESNILLFLVQVALLLGLARGLGEVFRRWGQPSITAEILVGILLGPTILGRFLPAVHSVIFPDDPIQNYMLDTVAWLGILFFLLKTGLETSLVAAMRQGKSGAVIALSDLVLPMAVAFVPAVLLPAHYLAPDTGRLITALFIATIMSISAMPVTARIMQDMGVYRTDLGLLIMSALTMTDVAGWLVFAMILGFVVDVAFTVPGIILILSSTFAFAALFLTLGSRLVNSLLERMERAGVPEPAGSLTLIAIIGMLGGAITIWIGIHALFGFFIAGIMVGEARVLSEQSRSIFSQMVQAILVPLFFASIGLRVDFLARFDLLLVLMILGVGIAGRYLGAWVGSGLTGLRGPSRSFVAAAHAPGGEMQIVIGVLALDYGVIMERVFVAIVLGAVLSSVTAGPWMRSILKRMRQFDWTHGFCAILPNLRAVSRDEAIHELCRRAAQFGAVPPASVLAQAVLERENTMTTAMEQGIAAPHARLEAITHPIVVIGRSLRGIDWNARDGRPAQLVFLVLTPTEATETQLRILQDIARAMYPPENRAALLESQTSDEMLADIRTAVRESTATSAG
jgi:Kef-type K+ transport system membrane component KefB/mannitol/fructose-specific phosphotransferase system IIA component (Ntr-type)